MKRKLVFITDCVDVAYSEIRGVVYQELQKFQISDDQIIIEPVAKVFPFSIINGSFILRILAESYPAGTVFSVILNPMQKRPERIFGRTTKKDFIFIGANTGVFDWFLKDFRIDKLYELNDPGFLPFGGKYVHAPAATKLAIGETFESMGKIFNQDKLLPLEIKRGTIVHVDNFGLMKFHGSISHLKEGDVVQISVNGFPISAIITTRMMARPTGERTIYPGSSIGLPELGKVRENGAKLLDAKPGDIIEFIDKKITQSIEA